MKMKIKSSLSSVKAFLKRTDRKKLEEFLKNVDDGDGFTYELTFREGAYVGTVLVDIYEPDGYFVGGHEFTFEARGTVPKPIYWYL